MIGKKVRWRGSLGWNSSHYCDWYDTCFSYGEIQEYLETGVAVKILYQVDTENRSCWRDGVEDKTALHCLGNAGRIMFVKYGDLKIVEEEKSVSVNEAVKAPDWFTNRDGDPSGK